METFVKPSNVVSEESGYADSSSDISTTEKNNIDSFDLLDDVYLESCLPSWLHLTLPVPTFSRMIKWCSENVVQTLIMVQELIFPVKMLRKDLDLMKERLTSLEEEMKLIKEQWNEQQNCNTYTCHCKTNQSVPEPDSNSSMESTVIQSMTLIKPPPPPPPLPPPPIVNLNFCLPKIKRKQELIKDQAGDDVKVPRLCVTLSDIQNVKLRKMQSPIKKQKKENSHLVSISDTHFNFRRNKCLSPYNKENRIPLNLDEVHQMRRTLRKVNINRSPGGTPVIDQRQKLEYGEGLIPMMTRALKKKFKNYNRLSVSPISSNPME